MEYPEVGNKDEYGIWFKIPNKEKVIMILPKQIVKDKSSENEVRILVSIYIAHKIIEKIEIKGHWILKFTKK